MNSWRYHTKEISQKKCINIIINFIIYPQSYDNNWTKSIKTFKLIICRKNKYICIHLIELFIALHYICMHRKGRRQKTPKSYGPVRKRGGGGVNFQSATKMFFLKKIEKDKECSETEKCVFWWKHLQNMLIWTCFMF